MLNVFTDGGARGNPGPAAIGVYIVDQDNKEIFALGKRIGNATNNVAEYTALLEAFNYLLKHKKEIGEKVNFYLDSQLVVLQVNGIYKVKNSKLRDLLFEIRIKEKELGVTCHYSHIRREKNKLADALVNKALDNLL